MSIATPSLTGHVPIATRVDTGSLTAPPRAAGTLLSTSRLQAGWSACPTWSVDGVGEVRPQDVGRYVFTAVG